MSEIVGIDVSKNSLDLYFLQAQQGFSIVNSPLAIEEYLFQFKGVKQVVLEATGGYEAPVVETLRRAKIDVRVINPKRIRDFAKACGKLAKTDKIDARVIAEFGSTMRLPEQQWELSTTCKELRLITTRRQHLVKLMTMEKNRRHQLKDTPVYDSVDTHIKSLQDQIHELELQMDRCIKEDEILSEKAKVLRQIKGVGLILCATLLAQLPELGYLNRRQIACLVGVACFDWQSGKYRGKPRIYGGRKPVRDALYMGTNSARQHDPEMLIYFQRHQNSGKPFKVTMVACMRKLIVKLNAMMREYLSETQQIMS